MSEWYKELEPPESYFWSYFDMADELFGEGGVSLEEMDQLLVQRVRSWARDHNLPWPPHLPTAEEALNDMNRFEAGNRPNRS